MSGGGKKLVVVIDGLGGGIGVEIVSKLHTVVREAGAELIALGSNAVAVERMVKAGAPRGACGENAIKQTAAKADFILGPIGIIIENSMLGEITQAMASAVLASPAKRIVLPLQNDHLALAGVENLPLAKMIERAVETVKNSL